MRANGQYPLTPPEGSWRKMKIISFFPNGKITNLKKVTIMKTVRNNKETKKVSVNLTSKVKTNVPNYLEMVRLYGANAVCNMLNNL
jgi:hypothetical protein